jgi:hypothetical protein
MQTLLASSTRVNPLASDAADATDDDGAIECPAGGAAFTAAPEAADGLLVDDED